MIDPETKELLIEVKQSLDEIKNALGIGKVAPARVVDLKLHAKRKAQEIKNKTLDKHSGL